MQDLKNLECLLPNTQILLLKMIFMQNLNLAQMSMLEELWEDLSKQATDNGFTPTWHINVLNEREAKVLSAESSFSSLSDAKKRLQSFVNKY